MQAGDTTEVMLLLRDLNREDFPETRVKNFARVAPVFISSTSG
jgi:hypothetical protein